MFVEDSKLFPIWESNFRFNSNNNGYYEKVLIGLDDNNCLIPVILSCGNGAGDNRILAENDETIPTSVYEDIIKWLSSILDTHIGVHYSNLILELIDWLEEELDKKMANVENK